MLRASLLLASLALLPMSAQAMNFSEAKRFLKTFVDQPGDLDYYCGCPITMQGKKQTLDLAACGIQPRKDPNRAARIEMEHVVPASHFGRQLQCWQEGGRKNCTENDPNFAEIEGDPYNLLPVSGELNADRGALRYGMVSETSGFGYGQCGSRVDFEAKRFMPRRDSMGDIARINFYFHDRYGMRMSSEQRNLFSAWDRMDPVDARECNRHARIARRVGWENPFVARACGQ